MKDIAELKDESRAALEEARMKREAALAREAHSRNMMQVAALVGGTCVVLNVAFWFLSSVYFADKRSNPMLMDAVTGDQVMNVRFAFAIFTGIVSMAAIGAAFVPKWVSHGLAAIAGLVALVASFFAFRKGMPMVLPVALFVIGVLFPVLVWRSLELSRGAWAFLISMCSVLALVLLFGAPKVRGVLGIGLWTAMIMPGLLAVATVGLTMLRIDYRERS